MGPQMMPEGMLMTLPLPVPARATTKLRVGVGAFSNTAVSVLSALIVILQGPFPEHPPFHSLK
jgi:hypothetical protein